MFNASAPDARPSSADLVYGLQTMLGLPATPPPHRPHYGLALELIKERCFEVNTIQRSAQWSCQCGSVNQVQRGQSQQERTRCVQCARERASERVMCMHWSEGIQMIWLGLKNGAVAGIGEKREPIVHWFPNENRVVALCSNREHKVWAVNSTHLMLMREGEQARNTDINRNDAVVGLVCVGENAWLVQLKERHTEISVLRDLNIEAHFQLEVVFPHFF